MQGEHPISSIPPNLTPLEVLVDFMNCLKAPIASTEAAVKILQAPPSELAHKQMLRVIEHNLEVISRLNKGVKEYMVEWVKGIR